MDWLAVTLRMPCFLGASCLLRTQSEGQDLKRGLGFGPRKCCRVLQLQLAQSKPTAPGLWAERVHQTLSRRLPSRFAQAPAAEASAMKRTLSVSGILFC